MGKKGTARIVLGFILVLFQIISLSGTTKSGNSLPSLSFRNAESFFYSLFYSLGFWIWGIIGLILIISGYYAWKKGSKQEEPSERPIQTPSSPQESDIAPATSQPTKPQKSNHSTIRLKPIANQSNSESPKSAIIIPDSSPKRRASTPLFTVISCVCVVSIVCACVLGSIAAKWKTEAETFESKAESYRLQLVDAKAKISSLENKGDFLTTKIGFIVSDSTFYHTYDCSITQRGPILTAHNFEYCKYLGYTKCPKCGTTK